MQPAHGLAFSRPLGRSQLTVTAIGLGCVTFGREIEASTALRILDHAYDRGIRFFDTAEKYGDGASETIVGEWLHTRRVRRDIVLASKVSVPLSRENIQRSVEDSLQRLRTDVIDLYQLHTWDTRIPLEETLAALDEEMERGRIREVGCSNFAAWQLCRALWVQELRGYRPLASVQPIYNLSQRDAEQELLPCCGQLGIGVVSYSPLGAGFLTGKYTKHGTVPARTRFDIRPGHQNIYFNEEGFRTVDRLQLRATETGISIVQLALSWVFRQHEITTVLVGARDTSHVDQAFEARTHAFEQNRLFPDNPVRP